MESGIPRRGHELQRKPCPRCRCQVADGKLKQFRRAGVFEFEFRVLPESTIGGEFHIGRRIHGIDAHFEELRSRRWFTKPEDVEWTVPDLLPNRGHDRRHQLPVAGARDETADGESVEVVPFEFPCTRRRTVCVPCLDAGEEAHFAATAVLQGPDRVGDGVALASGGLNGIQSGWDREIEGERDVGAFFLEVENVCGVESLDIVFALNLQNPESIPVYQFGALEEHGEAAGVHHQGEAGSLFHLAGVVITDHDGMAEAREVGLDEGIEGVFAAEGGDRDVGWEGDIA